MEPSMILVFMISGRVYVEREMLASHAIIYHKIRLRVVASKNVFTQTP